MDEFYRLFGAVELGPKDRPDHGKVLYERTGSGLAKRYTLDGSGWALDARTGERAFRLGDDSRVFLPNGREVPRPGPLAAAQPSAAPKRLYTQPPPKIGSPFGAFDETTAARAAGGGIGNRLFGRR
jgi:hypothetical protein